MKRLRNIFIALLLVDMLGLAGLWFGYSTLVTQKDKEAGLHQEILDETEKGIQLAKLRKALGQAEKESSALGRYFYDPDEVSQIKFITQIEMLGTSTSGAIVTTKSFDPLMGARPSFHGEFEAKGTWKEVYHFLRLIETFPGRIIINHFNVTSPGGKDDVGGGWSGNLGIDLVSLKKS